MPTNTTHYNLPKPLVNDPIDEDLWGGYLNTALDLVDSSMKEIQDSINSFMATFVGCSQTFRMSAAPAGWLEENGAEVSRTTYALLFAAIGEIYGAGDGINTFKIPDSRGLFERNWDHGKDIDTGRTFASIQADAIQYHTHSYSRYAATVASTAGGPTYPQTNTFNATDQTGNSGTTGTFASETRPKNIAGLRCIFTGVL